MNITGLCDIKRNPLNIEALQLFKIPSRKFEDYFYYHDIELDVSTRSYKHKFSKLSHDAYYLMKAQEQRQ